MHKINCLGLMAGILLFSATGNSVKAESPASSKPTSQTEIVIYKINANISGNTSLTEDLGIRDKKGNSTARLNNLTFFTLADLKIGTSEFKMDKQGATWNGKKSPPPGRDITVLFSPRIQAIANQETSIHIGSQQPIEYLQPSGDLYAKKIVQLDTGIKIVQTINPQSDKLMNSQLKIILFNIAERKPVTGLSLNVGEPVLKVDMAEIDLKGIKSGAPLGIQFHTKNDGILLIIMTVTLKASAG